MEQLHRQHAIHIPDPSRLARGLTLTVQVSDAGLVSITRGKLDISSRRMTFTQVGCLYVEGVDKHSDADVLLEAAGVNLDDEQRSTPW